MKKYQVNFLHLHVNGASNSKFTKFTLITYVDHHEKYRYILLNNVSSRIQKKGLFVNQILENLKLFDNILNTCNLI